MAITNEIAALSQKITNESPTQIKVK